MNPAFGPWTTGIGTGRYPQLSTFWKRRMTMLPVISNSQTALSRRQLLQLGAAGLGLAALPTVRLAGALAAADGEKDLAREDRIYVTTPLSSEQPPDEPQLWIIGFDPQTGEWENVALAPASPRFRVSPDGRWLAFEHPEGAIHLLDLRGREPTRTIAEFGRKTNGTPPVWSGDGSQIIFSLASQFEDDSHWLFETWRMNADGSNRTKLPLPETEGVWDWSPDGEWLVTVSSRQHARNEVGWQLFLMRPDGTEARAFTEGGNPFNPRFSPDGRQLVFTDGHIPERRGVWIINVDGSDRRHVLPTDGMGRVPMSVCWSPDGRRLAVAMHAERPVEGKADGSLEIIDLDGQTLAAFPAPERGLIYNPDWR